MIKYLRYILVIFIFIVPIAGFLTTPNDYIIKGENRMIAQFPDHFDKRVFFAKVQSYFNDRMLFKIATNELYYQDFHEYFSEFSSPAAFSMKGLDGWYYLGDSSYKIYSQHTVDMAEDINHIRQKVEFLKNIRDTVEVPFYFIVGPDTA